MNSIMFMLRIIIVASIVGILATGMIAVLAVMFSYNIDHIIKEDDNHGDF